MSWLDIERMLNRILFQRYGMFPKKEKRNELMVVCRLIEGECLLVDEETKEQKSLNFIVTLL